MCNVNCVRSKGFLPDKQPNKEVLKQLKIVYIKCLCYAEEFVGQGYGYIYV